MKYIIKDVGGLDMPFIFPETCDHKQISDSLPGTVISAGLCKFGATWDCNQQPTLFVSCWGKSVSLGNLMSRGSIDSEILERVNDRY